jgi:hypothetical protein
MSATRSWEIVLPEGTESVDFWDIPRLIARALFPEGVSSDGDTPMYVSLRAATERKHTSFLRDARAKGDLTPQSGLTRIPKKLHEWGGVVSVALLSKYVEPFGLTVRIERSSEDGTTDMGSKREGDSRPRDSQDRKRLEAINKTRGTRREILENWTSIVHEYGSDANGTQVARVLRAKRDISEKNPELKTVQNRLWELRSEGLIP